MTPPNDPAADPTPTPATTLLDAGAVRVLDVREAAEWAALDTPDPVVLDNDTTLVAVRSCGTRSAEAADGTIGTIR